MADTEHFDRVGRWVLGVVALIVAALLATCGPTADAQDSTGFARNAPGSAADAQVVHIGPIRATYMPHGYIHSPKSVAFTASENAHLAELGFTHQLHNIGRFDAAGNMACCQDGLDEWIARSPGFVHIGWVSGDAAHLGDWRYRRAVADWIAAADDLGLDGVMVDIEPFDVNHGALRRLLEMVRERDPGLWLGVNAPAVGRKPGGWYNGQIARIGEHVDAVAPMLYDQGHPDAAGYTAAMAVEMARYARYLPAGTELWPVLAAYSANAWHDPAVENIDTGHQALDNAGVTDGAAVYWWHEMGPADDAMWCAATGAC